jgi:WD40 repeat protein
MTADQYLITIALVTLSVSARSQPPHAFSVKDSIEMVRFSDPSPSEPKSPVAFSPDGKYFVVVTSRGILASNSIESTLWLYTTSQVRRFATSSTRTAAPQPLRLTGVTATPQVIATAPYESMLSDVRWSKDSRAIYFLAQDARGNRRLSRVDVIRHHVTTLSMPDYDVYQYAVSPRTTIFATLRPSRTSFAERSNHSFAILGIALEDLILCDPKFSMVVRQLWTLHGGGTIAVRIPGLDEEEHFTADTTDDPLSLSPNGDYAVLLSPAKDIAEAWASYRPATGEEHRRIDPGDLRRVSSADLNSDRLVEFSLVHLRDRTVHPLGAPMARQLGYFSQPKIVWSPDGKSVLLTNTFLPFLRDPSENHRRQLPCVAAVVDVSTMQPSCVAFSKSDPAFSDILGGSQLRDASFDRTGAALALLTASSELGQQMHRYRRTPAGWALVSVTKLDSEKATDLREIAGPPGDLPRVSIQQNLNDPPVLRIRTGQPDGTALLWDPNPQLKKIELGETGVLNWKDHQGHEWMGGLVKPVGYVPGKRYPLVIQMYQFHNGEFMTDGMATTAMAARPLASVGIMFLEVTKRAHTFDQTEMADHLEGILSAIDTLDSMGLVDPSRVGLIGFSASCPYVEYALIHEPGRFAAATIADGIDNSYMQAMLWGASNVALQEQFRRTNGALPFGKGLERWLKVAPNFQLDKIRTPLRIEAIRPASLLSEWELYSSLIQQKKPVDLIYIPDGQHILQKPSDRMESQQGNVDWFLFWLMGQENPSTKDKTQYQRWARLMH